jgi:hypothetical protein
VALIDCVVAPFDQRYVNPAGAVSDTDPPAQNVVGPPAVMVGVDGSALTVTVVGADAVEQPLAFVTVTPYEPDADTTMDCVVAPVDHRYANPAGALSVTEPPAQNVVAPEGVMAGVAGFAFTVTTIAADVAEQPLPFVTVTPYAPEAVAAMDCVVAPFDHRYVKPAGAVSVTEPPAQNVVGPEGVIAGVAGAALTVTTVAADVALQPLPFVTVTE